MRTPHSPQIHRRKRPREKKWVFLPEELWEELSRAARFQTVLFGLTGDEETASRNDWIEDSLVWALNSYWEEKGGRPESEEDLVKLAHSYAAKQKGREPKK